MNSLEIFSVSVRRTMIAVFFVATLAVAGIGQQIQPRDQGKRYGDAGFVGEPINLNVVDADVRDILNYITEQYGVNFVIDKSVKATPVTVNVSDVPWNIALDSILQAQELGVQVNGTILRVADSKILASEGELYRLRRDNQLDTAPLYTEFVRLNYARAKGALARGFASSGTPSDAGARNVDASFSAPRAGLPNFGGTGAQASGGQTDAGILPIIQRRLSRRGSVEVDERSNSLIITDVRENVAAIKELIAILDQPEPQVEIEARIVVATRNFSRDIGVQLNGMVFGPRGSGAQGGTLDSAPSAQPFPPSLPTQGPDGSLLSSIPNTVIGLTTGVFGTAQINMLISAGEQKGQAKIIATPRVTALNNQKAKIESKTQIPIQTIQPSQGGGDPIVTTTYVDVPLKLEITPQITDVGTVVLEVLAENASTAAIVSGAPPAINSQVMESQVTVPDGGTTVVGGVLFDDERENQNRTPGLSKIPILGNLFKRKGVQRNTNEILFFITPRIYRPDYATTTGSSGRPASGTVIQPVPMGNPPSNSVPNPAPPPTQPMPVVQPSSAAPVKP
ncbi:type IV pilus secretin PilQ [Leptolyngbya sp. 7M]|uniref:type IV pilus secretin PilQ n=1 Tax=Leptolyngbya sp. 7M TaxID=2812896 RepID=UPI001B8B7B08|nr:type IV pilus secretin PilQ [Leptolyngbya sp. 7M]QYO66601.1 type IV pilus secretin PilQ [Leptolyngbya sp. 7M]